MIIKLKCHEWSPHRKSTHRSKSTAIQIQIYNSKHSDSTVSAYSQDALYNPNPNFLIQSHPNRKTVTQFHSFLRYRIDDIYIYIFFFCFVKN